MTGFEKCEGPLWVVHGRPEKAALRLLGVTRDLKAFQVLYDRYLLTLPCVLRLSSTLVMKSIFEDRPLPL
ncbi:hypothetical protein [Paraburkholderia sp. EG304]|uniref:hypothetical protein n=1 Tax=Paraburkholderia sp. EG304 TaxID=3237015 RepID=UPI00397B62C9